MNLCVSELGITGTYENGRCRQRFTVGDRNLEIYAIRPHLYKHLAPAGSLYLQLQDENGGKIKDSETIAISAISSASYFHGMVRFLVVASLRKETTYFLELKGSGYTYGAGAHVAWVMFQNKFEFELYERQNVYFGKGIF